MRKRDEFLKKLKNKKIKSRNAFLEYQKKNKIADIEKMVCKAAVQRKINN